MKKQLLLAALALAGLTASAQDATTWTPTTMPQVTTDESAPLTYAIVNYRGYDSNCTVLSLNSEGTAVQFKVTQDATIGDESLWYFVTGETDGAVYLKNVAKGSEFALQHNSAHNMVTGDNLTGANCNWWILRNGVNDCGLAISGTATAGGTSCLDAANYGYVLSGGWRPANGDWQGTCWFFVALSDDDDNAAKVSKILTAYNSSYTASVIAEARAYASNLTGIFGLSSTDKIVIDFNAGIDRIAATATTEAAAREQLNTLLSTCVGSVVDKYNNQTISIRNVRRLNNNNIDSYLAPVSETVIDGAELPNAFTLTKAEGTTNEVILQDRGTKNYLSGTGLAEGVANATTYTLNLAQSGALYGLSFTFDSGDNLNTLNLHSTNHNLTKWSLDGGGIWSIAACDAAVNTTHKLELTVVNGNDTLSSSSRRVRPNEVPVIPVGLGTFDKALPETLTQDFVATFTVADNAPLFKMNSARPDNSNNATMALNRWLTTNANGLYASTGTYDDGEFFFAVPVDENGDVIKMYNVNNLSYIGFNGTSQVPFAADADAAGAFTIDRNQHGPWCLMIDNVGLNIFGNVANGSVGGWTVVDNNGIDTTSYWFLVYDNKAYEENLPYYNTAASTAESEEWPIYRTGNGNKSGKFSDDNPSIWYAAQQGLKDAIAAAEAALPAIQAYADTQNQWETLMRNQIETGNALLDKAAKSNFGEAKGEDSIAKQIEAMQDLAVALQETTAIDEITVGSNNAANVIYDLQGRRLAAPVKGINIINGRKVLVK